jgi:hypothetical protein
VVVDDNAAATRVVIDEGDGGHVLLAYVDAVDDVNTSLFSRRSAVGVTERGGEMPRQADERLNPIFFSRCLVLNVVAVVVF